MRVYAAGVNPVDWKIRVGYMQQVLPLSFPFTLGGDCSGVVKAIGPGVAIQKLGSKSWSNMSRNRPRHTRRIVNASD